MPARIDDLLVLDTAVSKTDLAKYLRDRETVLPADFGGLGDGVADDRAAIQAAFDRAAADQKFAVIPPGSYVEYKVRPGSYGVFVGLASPSVYSTSPTSYAYGVMTDSSGIRVMEYGMPGALLASYNTSEITLRVIRSLSGKVYYQVLGQAPVASPQPPIPSTTTIQASGLLYSSQDQIDDAVIAA